MRKVIRQAIDLFATFRGRDPKRIKRVDFDVPVAVAVIGHVDYIGYRTTYDGKSELYEHEFQPGSRPLLCASHDGKQLVLLGGRYVFDKDHGIVDRDHKGRKVLDPDHGKDIGFMRVRQANPRLRQKEVYDQIRAMGLTVKKTEFGEHRVTFKNVSAEKAEAAAHYTDDLEDALGTARHMASLIDRQGNPRGRSFYGTDKTSFAYRGYLCRTARSIPKPNGDPDGWAISKDGHHIGLADDEESCREAIDSLLD